MYWEFLRSINSVHTKYVIPFDNQYILSNLQIDQSAAINISEESLLLLIVKTNYLTSKSTNQRQINISEKSWTSTYFIYSVLSACVSQFTTIGICKRTLVIPDLNKKIRDGDAQFVCSFTFIRQKFTRVDTEPAVSETQHILTYAWSSQAIAMRVFHRANVHRDKGPPCFEAGTSQMRPYSLLGHRHQLITVSVVIYA